MDTISDKITDVLNNQNEIKSEFTKIKNSYKDSDYKNNDNTANINTANINLIRDKIMLLEQDEKILNEVDPLRKSDYGTARILKNNFKNLYNKQYTKNATLIAGILLVSGVIIKMSFYETIDYPRVL